MTRPLSIRELKDTVLVLEGGEDEDEEKERGPLKVPSQVRWFGTGVVAQLKDSPSFEVEAEKAKKGIKTSGWRSLRRQWCRIWEPLVQGLAWNHKCQGRRKLQGVQCYER